MDDYQVKLNDISRKIGILVTRYNELKEDYKVLENENKALKEQFKSEKAKGETLKQELNLVKVKKAVVPSSNEERTELKRKINEFIKEIDRCVAMLND